MGSRRTLITIAAIAVGAIAVFMIYGYVGSVKDEAFGEAERVKVFVVKTTVVKGTFGEETQAQKLIVEDEIPKKFFPPNAIRTFDDIAGKVAIADLAVNQIVTTDMFADPGTVQSSFSDRLEKINDEDQVAITISIDQIRGVAGLLQPGDFVNIMKDGAGACEAAGSTADEGASADTTEGEAAADEECAQAGARYVYQKVQILAIGQTPVALPGDVTAAAEGEEAAAPVADSGLLTFIVPADAAQVIASLDPGDIYLTLVSRDYKPVEHEPIDPDAPLPGEDPDTLTPYGPDGPGGE